MSSTIRLRLVSSLFGIALAVIAGPASATFRVGLVTNGVDPGDETDILNYVRADARVSLATLYDANTSVPSLATLRANTDALLFTTDNFGHNSALDASIGNLLADYVDAGGGVVLSTFAFNPASDIGGGGRIMTAAYSPIANQVGQGSGGTLNLAASNTAHPALQGVTSFGSTFDNDVTALQGAGSSVIARYVGGDILLAQSASGRVLGLSAFPTPGTTRGSVFLTGNYARLVVNSLQFSVVPEPTSLAAIAAAGVVGMRRRRRAIVAM